MCNGDEIDLYIAQYSVNKQWGGIPIQTAIILSQCYAAKKILNRLTAQKYSPTPLKQNHPRTSEHSVMEREIKSPFLSGDNNLYRAHRLK